MMRTMNDAPDELWLWILQPDGFVMGRWHDRPATGPPVDSIKYVPAASQPETVPDDVREALNEILIEQEYGDGALTSDGKCLRAWLDSLPKGEAT